MDILERLIGEAKALDRSIVLPEGEDARILRAARRLADERVARPILLGAAGTLAAAAAKAGVTLDGIATIDPARSADLDAYAAAHVAGRGRTDVKVARRLARKPLYHGAMMVRAGHADAMIAGAANPTRRVIEAGALGIGLARGISTPSSFFLMIVSDFLGAGPKAFIYADCALNVAPHAGELADIALASAATAGRLLGEEPRVALLSFSTHGSARHESIDKVTAALAIARERAPGLAIDGEFQADSAIVPDVAARKVAAASAVAGRANVLIFPDLGAGNIAYKLTQYMAGARAIGPILQGFAGPLSDLSRGASDDDITAAAAILLAKT